MRVAIADDHATSRTAVAAYLRENRIEVPVVAASADELFQEIRRHPIDVAIIDVRLSERNDEEGIDAARQVKQEFPSVAILMLSAQTATTQAIRLLSDFDQGIGYLRKDELDIDDLGPQLTRLVAGEQVLGRSVVSRLLRPSRQDNALASLTRQEREVLRLMAEGYSNAGIAKALTLTDRTIEDHVGHVFDKLGINAHLSDVNGKGATNKRVLAVLTWLRLAT